MAEKITIAQIDIDYDQAVKDTSAMKSQVGLLTAQLKKSKLETGDNSAETIKYESALRASKAELRQQQKYLDNVTTSQDKNTGSLKSVKAELSIVTKRWNELSKEERINSKVGQDLSQRKLELTQQLKGEEAATGDARRNVGNYSGDLNALIPITGNAAKVTKVLGMAFKATFLPLALLVGAVLAVKAAFTSSEDGQNKWAKIMGVTEAIIGNLNDVLASFGEKIISVFENPKESIIAFKNLIKENIQTRFEGLLELIPKLGEAIGLLFKGEFKEAGKTAADAVAKVALGVESFTDKVVEGYANATAEVSKFIKENQREATLAAQVADMRAKALKLERDLLVERAKLESQIAELRLKSREEDEYNATQRKEFLIEARNIQEQIISKETEYLELRKDAQVLENTFSRTNIENKQKEAEAIAAVSQKEAERFNQARQVQRELNTIQKQEVAELNKIAAEKTKLLDTEYENWKSSTEARLLKQEEYNLIALEKENELAAIKLEQDLINQQQYNQLLTEAKIEYEESERIRLEEVSIIDRENEIALKTENYYEDLALQQSMLERQKQIEVAHAKSIGADVNKIEAKYAQAHKQIEYEKFTYSLSVAKTTADNLVTIFGETTTAGKVAATASATISTLESAVSSFNAMAGIPYVGPILGGIAAAAALVAGYATVDEIWSVDTSTSGISKPSTSSATGYSGIGSKISSASSGAQSLVNTQLGQGIVSRDTGVIQETEITTEKVIVIDSVTEAQRMQQEKVILSES